MRWWGSAALCGGLRLLIQGYVFIWRDRLGDGFSNCVAGCLHHFPENYVTFMIATLIVLVLCGMVGFEVFYRLRRMWLYDRAVERRRLLNSRRIKYRYRGWGLGLFILLGLFDVSLFAQNFDMQINFIYLGTNFITPPVYHVTEQWQNTSGGTSTAGASAGVLTNGSTAFLDQSVCGGSVAVGTAVTYTVTSVTLGGGGPAMFTQGSLSYQGPQVNCSSSSSTNFGQVFIFDSPPTNCNYSGTIANPTGYFQNYQVTTAGGQQLLVTVAPNQSFPVTWSDASCSGALFTARPTLSFGGTLGNNFTQGTTGSEVNITSGGPTLYGGPPTSNQGNIDGVPGGANTNGVYVPTNFVNYTNSDNPFGYNPTTAFNNPGTNSNTNGPIVYGTNGIYNPTNAVNNGTVQVGLNGVDTAVSQGDNAIVGAIKQADVDITSAIGKIGTNGVNVSVSNNITLTNTSDYSNVLASISNSTAGTYAIISNAAATNGSWGGAALSLGNSISNSAFESAAAVSNAWAPLLSGVDTNDGSNLVTFDSTATYEIDLPGGLDPMILGTSVIPDAGMSYFAAGRTLIAWIIVAGLYFQLLKVTRMEFSGVLHQRQVQAFEVVFGGFNQGTVVTALMYAAIILALLVALPTALIAYMSTTKDTYHSLAGSIGAISSNPVWSWVNVAVPVDVMLSAFTTFMTYTFVLVWPLCAAARCVVMFLVGG